MLYIILWIFAALLTLDCLYRIFFTNFNMGSATICGLALLTWCSVLFGDALPVFAQTWPGRLMLAALGVGLSVYLLILGFIIVRGRTTPLQNNEKAIIVLGAGIRHGRLTNILRRRLCAALRCWQQNPGAYVVVTGGLGKHEAVPEAWVMAQYMEANGIPRAQIITEDKSISTEENFLFAKEMLCAKGVQATDSLVYVTNRFHCYRAGVFAARAGFSHITAAAADIGILSILPCYLREVWAVLYLWMYK